MIVCQGLKDTRPCASLIGDYDKNKMEMNKMERQQINGIETRRRGEKIEQLTEKGWKEVKHDFILSNTIRDIEMDETMARWPVLYGIMRQGSIPAKRR